MRTQATSIERTEGYFFNKKGKPVNEMLKPFFLYAIKNLVGKDFDRKRAEEMFFVINKSYSRHDRFYHTLTYHISDMLECVREKEIFCMFEKPYEAIIAIFFHDISEDVETSAFFCQQFLLRMGADREQINNIGEMILATKHDKFAETNDAKLVADLDLKSLSVPRNVFLKNTALLRLEFWNKKDNPAFFKTVTDFFQYLIDRTSVYQTEFFKLLHEDDAVRNLKESLKS